MITWMQKHKKYLVVTIWISTIAFVGAGFVGWGAYDLNSNRATSLAKVGHRNVSVQEFQEKYNQLYQYYASAFDGRLTQEKADELGLENSALQAAISENLLLNFADDIGLSANDEDVVKYIVANPEFQTDGAFNKNLYYDTLRRARINPNDYEKNLKQKILLDKLIFALNFPSTQKDTELLTASFFIQDRLAIEIINANENEIKQNEDEIKKLWEDKKNNYMTDTIYNLETLYVKADLVDANSTALNAYYDENKDRYKGADDKIKPFSEVSEQVKKDYSLENGKSVANEKYLAIKKGELTALTPMSVSDNNASFSIDELKNAKEGEVIKPFAYEDGYLIAKIKDITAPQVMSYEQARDKILEIYNENAIKEQLKQKAQTNLENFKGRDIGFVSKEAEPNIEGLDMFEAQTFITQLFNSKDKKGYVMLDDKVVLYDILEQKLLSNNDNNEYKEAIKQNSTALKNRELLKDLTNELQKRYEIKDYTKR